MTQRSHRYLLVILSGLLATLSAGCGRIVVMPVSEEIKMGAEVARQVKEQIGIYDAPGASAYIGAIGNRLISNLEDDRFNYTFQIVDQAEPNAFAVPGGHIYISRGLLALVNTEDELAGVIGHEIFHVYRRHSMRQAQKGILPGLLTLPGRIVGRVVSQDLGNLVNAPIEAVGQVYLSRYSRAQEHEADELGMQLAAKSGYDPKSLASILYHLEREQEMLSGEKRKFSFFDSHPTTPHRVKKIQRDADKLERSEEAAVAPSKRDFLSRLEGVHYGNNPAQGLFRGQQYFHPDLNVTIRFPDGWKTLNTPTAVGAFAPKKEALVFMGVAGKASDPEDQALIFISEIEEEFGVKPFESRRVNIGTWPGYLVTFTDETGRAPMHIHFLWVMMEKLNYQLIGVGSQKYFESMKETALSLRPMTIKERNVITATRLRIATANAGETLENLSRRTGNQWTLPYTAMTNSIDEDVRLEAGQLIKIARQEPYHHD